MDIGSVEEGGPVNVGGVWSIAQVEAEMAEAGWKVVKPRGKWRHARMGTVAEEVRTINAVPVSGTWKQVGTGEITIDSAAEESVCPKTWGGVYPTRDPARWLKFTNASGGSMNHYGEKEAKFTVGQDATVMSLGFQISDALKPLAAVWRIADRGNLIQFGPKEEDNFIQSITTKKKIPMARKGGRTW